MQFKEQKWNPSPSQSESSRHVPSPCLQGLSGLHLLQGAFNTSGALAVATVLPVPSIRVTPKSFFFVFFKTERPPGAAVVLLIPESGRSRWVGGELCQTIVHTAHLGSKIKIVLAIKSNMSKQIVFQKWPEVPRTPNPGRSRQILIHTSSAHRLCGKRIFATTTLWFICVFQIYYSSAHQWVQIIKITTSFHVNSKSCVINKQALRI